MIENYLLEELVLFSKCGTLAETARKLNVTQPTVTRGMKKLEENLGIKLFDRTPNKITLTKTGIFASECAQQILELQNEFISTIQKFDKENNKWILASVAPGPLIFLKKYEQDLSLTIKKELYHPRELVKKLKQHEINLAISHQEIFTDTIESYYIGSEKLLVNIDPADTLNHKEMVYFQDLNGKSFIVLNEIGIWKDIIETAISGAKFLYQENSTALEEILKHSTFPHFSTNLSNRGKLFTNSNRLPLCISDEKATQNFYLVYHKKNKKKYRSLINFITQHWPQ